MHRLACLTLAAAAGLSVGCDAPPLTLPLGEEPLPERLSDLGVLQPDLAHPNPRLVDYAPRNPLWTNGSEKIRWLALPEGAQVTEDAEAFAFPEGSYFFKTFAYDGAPVETRVMRRTAEGWEFAVYLWEGDDATLLDGLVPVEVSVQGADGPFTHVVPSRRDCRTCHESSRAEVIGFDADQLRDGMDALMAQEVFASPPTIPAAVEGRDAQETEVLGYIQGNCVHCHNGLSGSNRSFDMRPEVFVERVVGVETESSASPRGLRVSPGQPEMSVLYNALTREDDFAMPPLGVDVRDEAGVALIRAWIEAL